MIRRPPRSTLTDTCFPYTTLFRTGSFTESFPLFGSDLRDYEVLFEEKLDLFTQLLREEPVTWSGTTRPALDSQRVFPTTRSGLRARSEEHTSELQSLMRISYAVFCLKKTQTPTMRKL